MKRISEAKQWKLIGLKWIFVHIRKAGINCRAAKNKGESPLICSKVSSGVPSYVHPYHVLWLRDKIMMDWLDLSPNGKFYMDGPQPSHHATLSLPSLSLLSIFNNFLTLHLHLTVLLFWLIIFCVPNIYALSHNIYNYVWQVVWIKCVILLLVRFLFLSLVPVRFVEVWAAPAPLYFLLIQQNL